MFLIVSQFRIFNFAHDKPHKICNHTVVYYIKDHVKNGGRKKLITLGTYYSFLLHTSYSHPIHIFVTSH